jgi:sulfur-oxidizing protein SoxX
MPEASSIVESDSFPEKKEYPLPKSCNLKSQDSIKRGAYIFHNLNGERAKEPAPKGLENFSEIKNKNGKKEKVPKQYGNCVACHNIENAIGGGSVGPSLVGYKKLFIDTKIRDASFVYQNIADPRVDNPQTNMTINLTTKLFNEHEICDLTAYLLSEKEERKQHEKKK